MDAEKAEKIGQWQAAQPRFKAEHDARVRRWRGGAGWTNPGAPVTPEQFEVLLQQSRAKRKGTT